jgi:hypothetical protein
VFVKEKRKSALTGWFAAEDCRVKLAPQTGNLPEFPAFTHLTLFRAEYLYT